MIHPTSIVSPSALIHESVKIGPFSIVHDNVEIGAGTEIDAYCEIGLPTKLAISQALKIGINCKIRSHSVIYTGSQIGDELVTGHYVCIRENTNIKIGVQIGSRGDIQGDCEIGQYTKMHADVHVGKKSVVGDFVWIFPGVLLTNDAMPPSENLNGPKIGNFAVIASNALIYPGISIGKDSVIAAGAIVKESIESGKLAVGSPAKAICDASILRMPNNPKLKAYPWRNRFHRGYPTDIVEGWLKDLEHNQ